jgi:hypothetical protein
MTEDPDSIKCPPNQPSSPTTLFDRTNLQTPDRMMKIARFNRANARQDRSCDPSPASARHGLASASPHAPHPIPNSEYRTATHFPGCFAAVASDKRTTDTQFNHEQPLATQLHPQPQLPTVQLLQATRSPETAPWRGGWVTPAGPTPAAMSFWHAGTADPVRLSLAVVMIDAETPRTCSALLVTCAGPSGVKNTSWGNWPPEVN